MSPELCNHPEVTRIMIEEVGFHCICDYCFEEWVE